MNRKHFLIFLLLVSLLMSIGADDGSWNKSFSINGGSIYSETEDSEIVLEKELLVFNGAKTSVFFLFRNTQDRPVTVPCGFPVRIEIQAYKIYNHLEIPESKYGEESSIPSLEYFQTEPIETGDDEDEPMFVYPETIPINDFNNSREFVDYRDNMSGVSFQIRQDGRPLPIERVLLERHAGEDGAWITFHFTHDLVFQPGGRSEVRVDYTQDLLFGNPGMMSGINSFRWDYIIGTGSTWKGPIGQFYFLKPKNWKGQIDGMDLIQSHPSFEIYKAVDYEPDRDAQFSLTSLSGDIMQRMDYLDKRFGEYKRMWSERTTVRTLPQGSAQEFVTEVSASSSLSDTIPVFTAEGVIVNAGFRAGAAFDGIAETSWSENSQGNGIGEYLEVVLTKPTWAMEIHNGFKRFTADDWVFDYYRFEQDIRDDSAGLKDYHTMNGRVKELAIVAEDGRILYTLDLADQRDPQVFTGIILPEGRYRFRIEKVYEGDRWQDTCIAEIHFFETVSHDGTAQLLGDPFYRKALEGIRF